MVGHPNNMNTQVHEFEQHGNFFNSTVEETLLKESRAGLKYRGPLGKTNFLGTYISLF